MCVSLNLFETTFFLHSCHPFQYSQCSHLFCCSVDSLFFPQDCCCVIHCLHNTWRLHLTVGMPESNSSSLQFRPWQCDNSWVFIFLQRALCVKTNDGVRCSGDQYKKHAHWGALDFWVQAGIPHLHISYLVELVAWRRFEVVLNFSSGNKLPLMTENCRCCCSKGRQCYVIQWCKVISELIKLSIEKWFSCWIVPVTLWESELEDNRFEVWSKLSERKLHYTSFSGVIAITTE